MPRGTRIELTGFLLRHGRTLVLRVDDGGEWRLDAPARAWRLVGRRVSVTGVRDDFDLLAVDYVADLARSSTIRSGPLARGFRALFGRA